VAASLVLPVVAALVGAALAGLVQRQLQPRVALRTLTAIAVAAAAAVVWGLSLIFTSFLASIPWIADRAGWCHVPLPFDHRVPFWLGALSLVALAVGAQRGIQAFRRHRDARATVEDSDDVVIDPSPLPKAYAVPGKPGHIVVSTGMLRYLDQDDLRVLIAHEQSHLDHDHHRWVAVAEVAAAVVPLVARIAAKVRFASERWADEDAAAAVGDRSLVARAVAKAALAVTDATRTPKLALADLGVRARVVALLAIRRAADGRPMRRSASSALVCWRSSPAQPCSCITW